MSKIPVPKPTKSFWQTAEDPAFGNLVSTTTLPSETDILIVGSGYAGASTAYYLYKNGFQGSLVMLEARNLCSGASARNGGHLKPDLYMAHESFAERYGEDVAVDIANFEYDHLAEFKKVVESEKIDCDFVLTRSCDVHLSKEVADVAERNFKRSISHPRAKYRNDLQINYGDSAKVISKVEDSDLCITYTAGHVWVYKFVADLLRKSIDKGMKVYANTPALETKKLPDGRYMVKTNKGTIITKKLVLATNAYTSALESKFNGKIVPFKGICTQITSKDTSRRTPHLTNTYAIRFAPGQFDYLINRPDGSVIVGGAARKVKELAKFYNNTDDSTTIDDIDNYFDGYMNKTFYTWKDVPEKVSHIWSGIMGFSNDELPYVGEIPGDINKFIIAGFHGHGMPRVLLSAKGLADILLGDRILKVPEPFKITEKRLNNTMNLILPGLGLRSKL